jgi:hypothetical protein
MITDWRRSVPFSKGTNVHDFRDFRSAIADTIPGFIGEVFLVHRLEHGLDFKRSECSSILGLRP